jgi:hypothetical protein
VPKKPLIETNRFLKDRSRYHRDLVSSVSSSTAIETGVPVAEVAKTLPIEPRPFPVKTRQGSAR